MNATKRKFNALLQGLGGSPSIESDSKPFISTASPTSLSSGSRAIAKNGLLEKRQRLAPAGARATSALASPFPVRRTASTTSNSNRSPIAPGSCTGSEELVKYCPSDREQFLRRLASFHELTDWTPKPDRVSDVEWAKRGWRCQGRERVRCVLCHSELVVQLNRREVEGQEVMVLVASEIEEALVNKYADLIITSHQEDCLWRRRGCEDSLLRLSFASSKATLEALRIRYDELCTREPFLPYESNLRLPEDIDLDSVLGWLPPNFFSCPQASGNRPAESPNGTALALALLGWQGLTNPRIGSVPNSASCHSCLRRLGLWMFKSKEIDADGNVLVPAPMDHLDPVREHRFFCPWKNPSTQNRETSASATRLLSAWQLLLQALRNEAHLRSVYEGYGGISRPQSSRSTVVGQAAFSTSSMTRRGAGTPGSPTQPDSLPAVEAGLAHNGQAFCGDVSAEDKQQEARDKERWMRLRKVKSLFESKSGKRVRCPGSSRPSTSHTAASEGSR